MKTPWQPDKPLPHPQYPRPQLRRERWLNLNGWWDYAIQPAGDSQPIHWDGEILVPFPLESQLSGVQKPLQPDETLWYRRRFSVPEDWNVQRILLHFGAVDFACQVWVNEQNIGSHKGGYLPFSFEISQALQPGENQLIVAVRDPTDGGLQERGKQVLNPEGIWYTAVSGIWQTVWLEPVPRVYINDLKITPNLDDHAVSIQVEVSPRGRGGEFDCEIILVDQNKKVTSALAKPGEAAKLILESPKLWSPESPHLYDLHIRLLDRNQPLDKVWSYTALRKHSLIRDEQGYLRFALNNRPLFLYGPLDQGYFPDGLYTPPNEAAMLFDIQFTKEIGCNMIRKHVKVEPARWYYHCDRLGLIVWQDMPNGGVPDSPPQAAVSMALGLRRSDRWDLERFGRADLDNRALFKQQLQGMMAYLDHFACIAVWVPFNESWGQFHAKEIADWVQALDPSRLIDHASGWFDQGGGDFVSKHVYVKKLRAPRPEHQRAFVISEFGGYSLQIPEHVWDAEGKFGYRFYETQGDLTQSYLALLEEQLLPLIRKGLAAAIYTQTTDVETEVNGYLTYDRQVEKMDFEEIKQAHQKLKL